jgi:hypothetical protein
MMKHEYHEGPAARKQFDEGIAEVREEIELLRGWRFTHEFHPAALRLGAEAARRLAKLMRGWRGTEQRGK